VTNTYDVGTTGRVQRLVCRNRSCWCVVTAQVIYQIVNIDPDYGQGASSVAKKLKEEEIPHGAQQHVP